MTRTRSSLASVAAAFAVTFLAILCGISSTNLAQASPLRRAEAVPFLTRHKTATTATTSVIFSGSSTSNNILEQIRGGSTTAAAAVADEEEDGYDEDDEVEEDEEVSPDPSMAKSTLRAAQKAKDKAVKASKTAVSSKLLFTAPTPQSKGRTQSFLKKLMVPYILRALLNPLTLIRMTRGYWASLIQPDYLKTNMDPSQDLRNALETKAKQGGRGSGARRGKRSMKKGQSKSLSDLPPLPS